MRLMKVMQFTRFLVKVKENKSGQIHCSNSYWDNQLYQREVHTKNKNRFKMYHTKIIVISPKEWFLTTCHSFWHMAFQIENYCFLNGGHWHKYSYSTACMFIFFTLWQYLLHKYKDIKEEKGCKSKIISTCEANALKLIIGPAI